MVKHFCRVSALFLTLQFACPLAAQSAAPAPPLVETPAKSETGNVLNLFSSDDYPLEALRNEEQGAVTVKLDISAAGRVSACTVMQSSGSSSLDMATCEVLRTRAHFTSARDGRGRAVPDVHTQRVVWGLPDDTQPATDRTATTIIFLDAGGKLDSCTRGEDSEPLTALQSNECSGAQGVIDQLVNEVPGLRIGEFRSMKVEVHQTFPPSGIAEWKAVDPKDFLISEVRAEFRVGVDGKVIGRAPFYEPFEPLPAAAPQKERVGFTQIIVTASRR